MIYLNNIIDTKLNNKQIPSYFSQHSRHSFAMGWINYTHYGIKSWLWRRWGGSPKKLVKIGLPFRHDFSVQNKALGGDRTSENGRAHHNGIRSDLKLPFTYRRVILYMGGEGRCRILIRDCGCLVCGMCAWGNTWNDISDLW